MKSQIIGLIAALSFGLLALIVGFFVAPSRSRGLSVTKVSANDNAASFRLWSSSGNAKIVHSKWIARSQSVTSGFEIQLAAASEQSEIKVRTTCHIEVTKKDSTIEIADGQRILFQRSVPPGHQIMSIQSGSDQSGTPGAVLSLVSFVVEDSSKAVVSRETIGLDWEP